MHRKSKIFNVFTLYMQASRTIEFRLLFSLVSNTSGKPCQFLYRLLLFTNWFVLGINKATQDEVTTPCQDVIFTARRVCIARTIPWQDVCSSVCPSVCLSVRHTPVLCVNGYTYLQSFYRRVAPPFWFFHTKRGVKIPTGTPLTGAPSVRGV